MLSRGLLRSEVNFRVALWTLGTSIIKDKYVNHLSMNYNPITVNCNIVNQYRNDIIFKEVYTKIQLRSSTANITVDTKKFCFL